MTARKTWQAEETEVTRLFGGKYRRAYTADKDANGLDDCNVEHFAVEIKLHGHLGIGLMIAAVQQAEQAALAEGKKKIPVAVFRRPSDSKHNRMIMLRLDTFLKNFHPDLTSPVVSTVAEPITPETPHPDDIFEIFLPRCNCWYSDGPGLVELCPLCGPRYFSNPPTSSNGGLTGPST